MIDFLEIYNLDLSTYNTLFVRKGEKNYIVMGNAIIGKIYWLI